MHAGLIIRGTSSILSLAIHARKKWRWFIFIVTFIVKIAIFWITKMPDAIYQHFKQLLSRRICGREGRMSMSCHAVLNCSPPQPQHK